MRIDSSGNLALMTDGAEFKLYYTEPRKFISNNGASVTIKQIDNDQSAAYIDFAAWDDSSLMRLMNSGNLLVGTTSFTAGGGGHKLEPAGARASSRDTTSSQYHNLFYNPNGLVGGITTSGSATSYNTSSDYRLKEDVQPVANASDRLMQLKPCNFAWKADGSRVDGFLAHEAAEVVPEAVSGTKDAMTTEDYEVTPAVYEDVVIPAVDEVLDEDGMVITEAQEERTEQQLVSEAVMGEREVEDYQGIDQSKLVPLLTAALQEALARIEALENK
jgi:hypothetical protein